MKKVAIVFLTLIIIGGNILYFFWGDICSAGYKIGDTVQDFQLKNIDGRMLGLSELAGPQGVVVIFTCNHCPYAKAYEDRIEAINKKYASQGFPIVAINPTDAEAEPEDTFEEMQKRATEKAFSYPYLKDETQAVGEAFGAKRTPYAFLLKKVGIDFQVVYMGGIDDNADAPEKVKKKYLETALDELLAGKAISKNTTKAIGCSIRWRKK